MVSEAQERVPAKYKKKRADAVTFSFDKENSIPFQEAVEASGKSKASYVRDAIEEQLREDGFYQGERTYEMGFDR